ncbi:hypothetical protein EV363DRAFT_1318847 [Boletus edulis]|nr:hypothetical protein EV363DRAFT_1318847 [Boletus edulis]
MPPKADWEKYGKKVDEKEEKIQVLTDSDIQILKTYARRTPAFLFVTINDASCRVKVHTLPS